MTTKPNKGLYWHADRNLLGRCYNRAAQVRYLKENKPDQLRLFKPVEGELPAAVIEAFTAYYKAFMDDDEAATALDEAAAACDKARAALNKAIADNMPALLELHAKESGIIHLVDRSHADANFIGYLRIQLEAMQKKED
jgi:hypothetical protein